ncbi:MAG: ATP-binding protein [Gammaproteobacteria bacterium]
MLTIVGRDDEQAVLESAYQSNRPEFIAVYGRRRVGKTYLIRNHFANKPGTAFFYATGTKDGSLSEQITNFTDEISRTFLYAGAKLALEKNWRDTLKTLTDNINAATDKKKIVLFIDEFPWMVTRNSKLLQTLEYYWNHHWSRDPRIKLIICGSSSGWILKNIINNKGGLHNRVTRVIHLEPFDLNKTKKYLTYEKIKLTNEQIVHIYMVLGGIPYYLSRVASGLSATQVIEDLSFKKDSFMLSEFNNLYATLFGAAEMHINLARIIASHRYGIGQEDIATQMGTISSGGRLTTWLNDLEQAGFIIRFKPFSHGKRGIHYKMIDEYSLFYFHWLEPLSGSLLDRGMRKGYWESIQQSPSWHSWAGYAFELVCYKHIPQISKGLNISPTALPYTWKYAPHKNSQEQGAQIDLLFDRNDDSITLCEIKYTEKPYAIDKQYAQRLQQKIDVFKKVTRTRKNIFLAMITSSGLKDTIYSEEMIQGIVTLNDLFKEVE